MCTSPGRLLTSNPGCSERILANGPCAPQLAQASPPILLLPPCLLPLPAWHWCPISCTSLAVHVLTDLLVCGTLGRVSPCLA